MLSRLSPWLASCLCLLAAGCADGPAGPAPWTVICVLSYDNDLEVHASAVLDRLEAGVRGSRNAVTVLADYRGPGGLVRYEIDAEGRRATTLETDDIASENVVGEYLHWAAAAHPAERFAVVFLDHGGGLDEMCQDLHPPGPPGGRWLSGRRMGPLLRYFREQVDGRVELLFLQQCGRGTVEGLYNFRGAARAVLASQTRVGAPNTYYTPVLRWLGENPGAGGFAFADRIIREDRHFNTYACVDGAALAELPARLDAVLEEAAALSAGPWREPKRPSLCYRCWIRPDEDVYDCIDWLTGFYEANGGGVSARELTSFRAWVRDSLIVGERRHPRTAHMMRSWTGLGMLVPRSETVRNRHRGYPFYEAGGLDEFWERMYGGVR